MDEFLKIIHFMIEAFGSIWPYLLITIPLAVAVQMSGAARYINRAFQARPMVAILLATAVGAFSPFCSASVIPVVATLLIGGVPLAPVMAFWIASPLMDPEIFFLSVATIGWELAVWRLGGTLLLSLSAGLLTHLVFKRGWLGPQILRSQQRPSVKSIGVILQQGWQGLKRRLAFTPAMGFATRHTILAAEAASCETTADISLVDGRHLSAAYPATPASSGNETGRDPVDLANIGGNCRLKPASFRRRLLSETGQASLMMAKFMALAFFLEALITLYIPDEWIAGLVGRQNEGAIIAAAFIGVPVYTSNLAALPLVSGLLTQGMNPAAALAFLIAGPTTTLPAMAAVWGLTTRRVFSLYVSFSLGGAIALGYLYSLAGG